MLCNNIDCRFCVSSGEGKGVRWRCNFEEAMRLNLSKEKELELVRPNDDDALAEDKKVLICSSYEKDPKIALLVGEKKKKKRKGGK